MAHGLRPPSGPWTLGGVCGRTRAGRGPADAYVRRRACGQGGLLGVERCREVDVGRLRGGRERVHRDDRVAARGVPPSGCVARDLAAVAFARCIQGPQHADGDLRGEVMARAPRPRPGCGTGGCAVPELPRRRSRVGAVGCGVRGIRHRLSRSSCRGRRGPRLARRGRGRQQRLGGLRGTHGVRAPAACRRLAIAPWTRPTSTTRPTSPVRLSAAAATPFPEYRVCPISATPNTSPGG